MKPNVEANASAARMSLFFLFKEISNGQESCLWSVEKFALTSTHFCQLFCGASEMRLVNMMSKLISSKVLFTRGGMQHHFIWNRTNIPVPTIDIYI
jgi:hypothetical protein